MKNNKNKSKNKEKYNNKNKNKNKKDSKKTIESNEDLIQDIEEINNDIPKKQTKGKNKKNIKKKISENNKKGKEDFDENDIIPNAMVIDPSIALTSPKITKMIEEEEKIDSIKENQKDEFKIAKYFSQTKLIEPKNTSKDLLFIPEEEIILSLCDGKLYSLNILTYKIQSTFSVPKTNIISFTYNDKLRQIITLLENSMITIFDFDTEKIINQIKIHKAAGKIVKIDPSKNFFAVVTSRNNINIYNIKNLNLECVFEEHNHIIYDIIFNPIKEKFELYSCSEDSTVRVWNLLLAKCTNYFYNQGISVRHLQITNDGNFLIGGTLDNQIYVWKLLAHQNNNEKNSMKPKIFNLNKTDAEINFECMLYYTKIIEDENNKIIPTLILGDDDGNLTELNLNTGNIIDIYYINLHQAIVQIYFLENDENNDNNYLYIFTSEQTLIKLKINILKDNISNAEIIEVFPFYCQEILSLKWLDDNCNFFAFASNDNLLKIYDVENNKINFFEGHTDFIMSITIKNNLIITSSKDNTMRIWKIIYNENNKYENIKCIGELKGHSESVNCADIYIKKNSKDNFVISGCKDGSIKLWNFNNINDINEDDIIEINESLASKAIHDDEINSIKFAPNGKMFASASYDKSIKLFEINSTNNNFNLIHTLSGHKKGVTDISFSPYAKILASCGTDKLIKMWNLVDFSCLNTYEGHLSSVLKIDWIYRGTHLISGGCDGLIKLWNVKTSENILTLDAHEGKIWALDINKKNNSSSEILNFISGGTDGKIILWKDNTREEELKINEQNLTRIQKEDQLRMMNFSKQYIESMKLALELNHKKNFIDAFDNYIQERINEEINKINMKNNLYISNYTLPKMKDIDSTNDDLLNVIIQNEKELDQIYTLSSKESNEQQILNSYEKIIDIICKEESLKKIITPNLNKIIDIILENNINVRNCLAAQVLLKIVLKYVTPQKFFKKIINEDKKNELDEETIEELLEGGIYSSLGIKGAKALTKEEKKELKLLQKKTKREEETLLQKLDIIEGYSNQHLKRIKKEIINSQILGYEINKLKAIS